MAAVRPDPVPLGVLADAIGGTVVGDARTTIADLTHDSRAVPPRSAYAARPGVRADGHDFVPDAVASGAVAVLAERVVDLAPERAPSGPAAAGQAAAVPFVLVPDVAAVLGPAAALVHGHPSQALALLGVTGTNGKTTTAYLLEAGLRAAGHRAGLVGTVETRIADEVVAGVRTTPEATDLQRLLARMRARGVTGAAMEVSSHGLALGRVAGTRFAAVGFTNLSHDHLDFHGTLAAYRDAKATLLTDAYAPVAVVNLDDETGRDLAARAPIPVVGVTVEWPRSATPLPSALRARLERLVRVRDVDLGREGSSGVVVLGARRVDLRVGLPGPFNVANAALALAMLDAAGVDPAAAAAGIAELRAVPGRMERVEAGQPFTVVVDYAHTPDALERVLAAARAITDGRVIVVLGAGGDRDAAKRPVMGRVAAAGADLAVLTSDNPRSEDPEAILDALAAGAAEVTGTRVVREVDRRSGIAAALDAAGAGDVVVVAGKGHERVQELATGTVAFDDREVVRAVLSTRGAVPATSPHGRRGGER